MKCALTDDLRASNDRLNALTRRPALDLDEPRKDRGANAVETALFAQSATLDELRLARAERCGELGRERAKERTGRGRRGVQHARECVRLVE
jgi:hypothetical protein